MKISLTTLLLTAFLFSVSFETNAQKGERKYVFTPEKSSITWTGDRGDDEFSGKLKVKEGYITFNDEEMSQAVIFADVQSIDCKSCGDAEKARDILEYIQSKEFLNVETMDFAVFKMYKSSKVGDGKDRTYRIEGDLTIIGYSNTISIPVVVVEKKKKVYIEGKLSMNRSLWNLNNPKDSEIKEHIEQTIDLYFKLEGEIK
jgi:polyisoprenoid-binding protein YceI